MDFSMSRQPIARQIAAAMAALSLSCFGALSFWLSQTLSTAADTEAEAALSSQLDIAALAMDAARLGAERQAESLGKQFLQSIASRGRLSLDDSALARTGPLMLPRILLGKAPLNNDVALLEEFKKSTGSEAAILAIHRGGVYRIATLLLDKDGKPMLGTQIPESDLAAKTVHSGLAATNVLPRNGTFYAARVTPLLDASGNAIAFLSIRVDLTPDIKALKALLASRLVGKSGRLFAYAPAANGMDGVFTMHASLEGKPFSELNAASPEAFEALSKAAAKRGGSFRYAETDALGSRRPRFLVAKEVPSWGWHLAGGAYLDEFHDQADALRRSLFGAAALGALVLAVASSLLLGARLAPLSLLRARLGRQALGDFTAAPFGAPAGSLSELHLLAHSVDAAAATIHHLASTSRDGVLAIDHAALAAKSAAELLSAQAAELASSARSMAASIDALGHASAGLRTDSASAAEATRQAVALAGHGRDTIELSHATQQGMRDGIAQASDAIKTLGARGASIRSMAGAIGDIARQTNLLALNAAIEAARAGESGRGFAVVADEVRKLAERSARAANDIQATIESIARETGEASALMLAISDQSTTSLAASSVAGQAFSTLAGQSAISGSVVARIDQAIQDQAGSLAELSSMVRRVADGAGAVELTARDNSEGAHRMGLSVQDIQAELGKLKT